MHYIIKKDNDVLRRVIEHLGGLHPEKEWGVEIGPHTGSKSRQQERYFHDLIDIILEFQSGRIDKGEKEQLKRDMAWECGFIDSYTPPRDSPRNIPRKTSGMNVKEYSALIDHAQFVCLDLGLKYPDPRDLGLNIS